MATVRMVGTVLLRTPEKAVWLLTTPPLAVTPPTEMVLVQFPAPVARTSNTRSQVLLPAMFAPLRLTLVAAGTAVTVVAPLHVV